MGNGGISFDELSGVWAGGVGGLFQLVAKRRDDCFELVNGANEVSDVCSVWFGGWRFCWLSCCVVLGIGFEWIGFCEMEEFNFKVDAVRPGVVDVRDNIL